jgi:hypothetical protein
MSVKLDVGNSDVLRDWRNGERHSENVDHLKPFFYVVAVISNPIRYSRRWQLYKEFAHRMHSDGIQLMTVELAQNDRNFEVTHKNNPMNLQLRTKDELWHKESMINLGVSRLPEDWKYVAWIDADIEFENKNWVSETIHALQHYDIVQLFSQALDLGPNGEILQLYHSFCYSYIHGKKWAGKAYCGSFFHPGYAWCCTREAWNKMGSLLDIGICGSMDHHIALALIGHYKDSVPHYMHSHYIKAIEGWEKNAEQHIQKNIGYVNCIIRHNWHGKKKNRKYVERWDILRNNNFDPLVDIKRDYQGLWQLSGNKPKLRDDLRKYMRQRSEDTNDNEE